MIEYFKKLYMGGFEELLAELAGNIDKEDKRFLITANPETFMMGKEYREFDEILKKEYVTVIPDGIGIVKGARLLGKDVQKRITGVDICGGVLSILDAKKKSIYLFGAKEEIGDLLCQKINVQYPNIKIAGYTNGYVNDKDKIMEEILMAAPDVILVALGIPQQEMLINRFYEGFNKGIFIGVGGSFDVLSGAKERAPKFFVRLNLEWLYRITKEPKRLKRFCKSNMRFVREIYKIKKEDKYNEKN